MRHENILGAVGLYTSDPVRTNIDIDDDLLREAMTAVGLSTKKATVEEALRRMVQEHRRRRAITDMTGLDWTGDLDAMRQGRNDP